MINRFLSKNLCIALILATFVIVPNFYLFLPIDNQFLKYLLSVIFILLILILSVLQLIFFQKEKISFKVNLFDLNLILFILAYLFSSALSIDIKTSIFGVYGSNHGGLIFALGLVGFFYISRLFLEKNRLNSFFMASFISALVSVFLLVFLFDFNFSQFLTFRAGGPEGHPIYHGVVLMTGLFSCLTILKSQDIFFRRIAFAFTPLLILLLLSNGTRSIWISIVISTGLILGLSAKELIPQVKRHAKWLMLLTTLLLAGMLIWQRPIDRVKMAYNTALDPSVSIRLNEWRDSLKLILDSNLLVGSGPATVQYRYPFYVSEQSTSLRKDAEYLHSIRNIFLNYAANLGIIPALVSFIFFGAILIFSLKLFLSRRLTLREHYLEFALFLMWVSLLVFHLFYHYTVVSALYFWTTSGILVATLRKNRLVPEFPIALRITHLFKIFSLLFLLALLLFYIWVFISEIAFAKALQEEDLSLKISQAEKVIKFSFPDSRKLAILGIWNFEQAIKLKDSNPDKFKVYSEKGIVLLKQAIEKSPQDAKLYNDLAVFYYKISDKNGYGNFANERIKYLMEATKKDPASPLFRDNLGHAYLTLQELDRAEENFKKAIFLKEDYFISYYHLGEVNKQKGKFEEAKNWYLKSLEYVDNKGFVDKQIKEIETLQEKL